MTIKYETTTADIKAELDRIVRRAANSMAKATERINTELAKGYGLDHFAIEEMLTAQADKMLATWVETGLEYGASPEEILANVRKDATRAVWNQDHSTSLVSRAEDEARRIVFVRFLEWTDNLLG